LYLAYVLIAFGWAGTSLAAINNTLGLWFDKRRGMAISLRSMVRAAAASSVSPGRRHRQVRVLRNIDRGSTGDRRSLFRLPDLGWPAAEASAAAADAFATESPPVAQSIAQIRRAAFRSLSF
jgi:hypothetical protein